MNAQPDLAGSIEMVDARLAAAAKAVGPFRGSSEWHARHRGEMDKLADVLRVELGASINDRWDTCRVRICGTAASSTGGLSRALRNWLIAARRKLDRAAA